ncbi:MAG: HlyD family efflux transporter periplasmic adaptor subunit [Candidatus Cloacimonetes bacterium]|nr:HlyD family efflux transporter periplasmic adaptor subunit [Candidatus Cloacimonadota bacterium]
MRKVLAILGFWLVGCSGPNKLPDSDKPVFEALEKKELEIRVHATGKILPWLSVEVKCKASGQVISIPHQESSLVKQGDLLLELDPVEEKRRLQSAEVNLKISQNRALQARISKEVFQREVELRTIEAQSNLRYARSKFEDLTRNEKRIQDLISKNLSTPQDLETATTQRLLSQSDMEKAELRLEDLRLDLKRLESKTLEVEIAQRDVELKEVALELASQALADTRVFATMDGVVTALKIQVGQIISSGISNVGGGTTILTLADTNRLMVRAMVDESDIGRVRVGQRVSFSVDSFLFRRFEGRVIRVAAMGETIQNVVLFQVDVEITDADKKLLKPEMSASIEIEVESPGKVLCLPFQAIYEDRGRPWVMAKQGDSEPKKTFVRLGMDDGQCFSVLDGLDSASRVQVSSITLDEQWEKRGRASIRL